MNNHVEESVYPGINRERQGNRRQHTNEAGQEAHNHRLRVKHPLNIALAGANRSQNTDLFAAFQNRNKGDDSDHDRGHHQRNRHKGDE